MKERIIRHLGKKVTMTIKKDPKESITGKLDRVDTIGNAFLCIGNKRVVVPFCDIENVQPVGEQVKDRYFATSDDVDRQQTLCGVVHPFILNDPSFPLMEPAPSVVEMKPGKN